MKASLRSTIPSGDRRSIICSIIILFFLPCAITYAQPLYEVVDPESFFPHHVGDTWQYTLDNTNIIYDTDIIVADSTDSLGGHYLQYKGSSGYRFHIDTSYNVYTVTSGYHYYKLDADSGESWDFYGGQITARVVDIYPSVIFGINTTIKEIEYWLYISQTDSQWIATRFLASEFGLVAFWGEPGPFYHLTGAIIDSVQYGFIVSIDEQQTHPILPTIVELYQNYPNPFNSSTIISYQLNRSSPVVLEIYNSLGQKVKTLVNELQPPDNYKVRFDASNLPSGIYYYRIQVGGFSQQKKMLLIK